MMKFTQAINVAVASVLVVPAVTLQGGAAQSLRESLDATLLSLETLAGIEQRLEQVGPPEAGESMPFTGVGPGVGPGLDTGLPAGAARPPHTTPHTTPEERARISDVLMDVMAHTEPAPAPVPEDPGAQDRLLESLRTEVARLQGQVDLAATLVSDEPGQEPVIATTRPAPRATVGLDDDMRALLASAAQSPKPNGEAQGDTARTSGDERGAGDDAGREPIAFEQEGFSADPLKLAQAYYRKGDYQSAVDVLERHGENPEALYWRARSLEKLGAHDAAIEAYTAVSELEEAGPLGPRALEDIEFLRWRLDFERKQSEGSPR